MLAYQIIAGFSEIKLELRKQTRVSKSLNKLRLWFSLENKTLYVHDYEDHKKKIELANYISVADEWTLTFRGGVLGKQVIDNVVDNVEKQEVAKRLNLRYRLYGFFG